MLEIRDLTVRYGAITAVEAASLRIDAGECVGLVGLNGAGKSSLLMAAARLLPVHRGDIRLDGRSIASRPRHRLPGIGIVPEARMLAPTLTVDETLRLGARTMNARDYADSRDRMMELFPMLAPRGGQRAGTLSGGQAQMLAIARALVGRPRLLLVDEPTLGLSPAAVREVVDLLTRLRSQSLTMLVCEQSLGLAAAIADRVAVMRGGRIVAERNAGDMPDAASANELIFG